MSRSQTDLNLYVVDKIRAALSGLAEEKGQEISTQVLPLVPPRDEKMGDLGLACFPFAKGLRMNPVEVCAELAKRIAADEVIEKVQPTGPFLNFRLSRQALAKITIQGVLLDRAPFGPYESNGKTVVIDYSSPNIAKPFHLGHLRSTVIGAALRRLYLHAGYEVHGINHLGDWGAQFGKIIVAWREWGDEEALEKNTMRHLFEIYVRYGRESKERPELDEQARIAFQNLESGEDNEERRLWKKLRSISLEAFQGPYSRLGVEFDHVTGESFYEDKMEATVQAIEEKGIATMSDGALVVDLSEEGLPPCILRKSDGTTIYATRDLAALFYRRETFGFDRLLYVVGQEQKLHFRQLKLVLEKLGWPEADRVQHVDFGLILFWHEEEKKWKKGTTRGGNAIFLDEVLDEAVAGVRKIIEEKNPDLSNKENIAEMVGVSAIVFNDLKNERIKDIKFDWDRMLSFEGETGPYVQFAGARLASILRKAGAVEFGAENPGDEIDYSTLADAERVLLVMQEFGPTLQRAVDKNEPSLITSLMIRLASSIHSYLREHHVLSAEEPVRSARLALIAAARKLLATGLATLGVASPEEM